MAPDEMNDELTLVLSAYYEALYERLELNRSLLRTKIETLLSKHVEALGLQDSNDDKYMAYRDACLAFVDERIETYNPIGIQYTFDRFRSREAVELELHLNWYDSQAEFRDLTDAIRTRLKQPITEEIICKLADELIKQVGAFPDRSIIAAYEADPALIKLPDYVVALAIEELIA